MAEGVAQNDEKAEDKGGGKKSEVNKYRKSSRWFISYTCNNVTKTRINIRRGSLTL